MAAHEVTRPVALDPTLLAISQAIRDVTLTMPVVDNLTTNDGSKALSAKQGKILNDTKLNKTNVYNGLDQINEGYALDARQGKVLNEAITSLSSDLSALSGIVPKIVYRSEDSASYTFSEGHDNMFLVLCKSRNSDSYAVYLVLDRNALLRVNTIGNNSLTYSVSSKTMTVSGASDINMSVVKMW